jgi:A/G-specific adenine glycosylase
MASQNFPFSPARTKSFRRALLRWYELHRRDLPWRRDHNPYRIWVSEIMLQQTRVAAALDHYAAFLQRFPSAGSLAAAREASVLAVWSGLGYYHRARRMHQTAKLITRERGGAFPRTTAELSMLPGIGRYTAAAIASIAFNEPAAVVDGNVQRVLQRLFGSAQGPKETWQRAESLLDRERPGDFNQAMMELGATICTPRTPRCPLCPIKRFCETRGGELERPRVARKRKDVCYALARKKNSLLLIRRPADATLMAGMWELPAIDCGTENTEAPLLRLRHSITDTDYEVIVRSTHPNRLPQLPSDARWFSPKQWKQLPLTGLARKILRRWLLVSNDDAAESICQ